MSYFIYKRMLCLRMSISSWILGIICRNFIIFTITAIFKTVKTLKKNIVLLIRSTHVLIQENTNVKIYRLLIFQDSERREIYVAFYLPNDDPLPYFQWKDLVPGKFIAILLPCIHFYNDRTVGLRIDNASHVYCFDVEEKV